MFFTYKITWKVTGEFHDGYCSDPYDNEEDSKEEYFETEVTTFRSENENLQVSDIPDEHKQCHLGSGYCGSEFLWSATRVERFDYPNNNFRPKKPTSHCKKLMTSSNNNFHIIWHINSDNCTEFTSHIEEGEGYRDDPTTSMTSVNENIEVKDIPDVSKSCGCVWSAVHTTRL